jgi:TolB-like protein
MTPISQKLSLAVLPFENIGGDPSWRRLADGMTQDITTDLSQSKDLLVIARNSTEIYRGKAADVRDVGRELGVRYVLQGSIQPGDNRIRITAQLIDARSGENVWSTRYNRPVADIFEVQSNVTESIAATLAGYEGAMAQAERKLIRRKPPSVLMAYDHYLLGVEAKHGGASGGVTKEGLDEAERRFLKALEIDPQLARAYVGLSYVYEYRLDLGIGVPAENGARLIEFANKAVALDPNDAEAQMVLGHAFAYQGLADQALQQFARAEALAPSNADVLILIAWYLPQLDQSQRAVALVERALRLNPNYPRWYNQGLRYVYFCGGAFDKAVKFVKLVPNPNPLDFAFLALASAMLDDMPAAKAAAAELHRRDPTWNVETYLSDTGAFPEKSAAMFVDAARKAGVPTCAPAERIDENTTFMHLKICDEERARNLANAKVLTVPAGLAPH